MCAPLDPAPGISLPLFTQNPRGWLLFGGLVVMLAAVYALSWWRFERLHQHRIARTLLVLSFPFACGVLLVMFVIEGAWEAPLAAWWMQQNSLARNPEQLGACYNAVGRAYAAASSANGMTTAAIGLALACGFVLLFVAVSYVVKHDSDIRVANVPGQDTV